MEKIRKIIFYICLVVFVVCIGILILRSCGSKATQELRQEGKNSISSTTIVEELPDNPINFDKIMEKSEDIYSWIRIDGTDIDYEIVNPNGKSNDYYLRRNALGEYYHYGVIYTENQNSTDWSDPVTLVYGHNIYTTSDPDKKMFFDLHKFEDATFFKNHKYFNIYAPNRMLTYKIYSAFEYDDRHIMNSFDFSDENDLKEFIDTTLNPKSLVKNVREGVEITTEDKIVVLSTCVRYKENQRYLVVGVLEKDEKTK